MIGMPGPRHVVPHPTPLSVASCRLDHNGYAHARLDLWSVFRLAGPEIASFPLLCPSLDLPEASFRSDPVVTMLRLAHVLASVLPLASGVVGTCKTTVDPVKLEGDMKTDG